MDALKRGLVAMVMMALTLGVAAVPLLGTAGAANAEVVNPAGCTSAKAATAKQAKAVRTAKKALASAKKKLKKAKKAKLPKAAKAKKVKKAKKTVVKRQKTLRTKRGALSRAQAARARNCATKQTPPNPRADSFGQLLALFTQALSAGAGPGGAASDPLDVAQLRGVLALLSNGQAPPLDPAALTQVLGAFNGSELSPAALSELLGGALDPAQITALLDGGLDPAALAVLFGTLLEQFEQLAGTELGFELPSDPGQFIELFTTGLDALTGALSAEQLGVLLNLLASLAGSDGEAFDLEQLTALLEGLLPPQIADALDGELGDILAGFNGVDLDPELLFNLFAGQFSPEQIAALLAGLAPGGQLPSDALIADAIGQVVAQLVSLGGGDFELPSSIDPALVTGLVDGLADLVEALLEGLFGDLPELPICVLPIPVLCT